MGCGWVGGAYDSWDGGIVGVADGLPCSLHASEHSLVYHLPQLSCLLWECADVDFKVSEVVDQQNCSSHAWDDEFNDVAMKTFWISCLILGHSPGARINVVGGEEVGHSAAEHSQ